MTTEEVNAALALAQILREIKPFWEYLAPPKCTPHSS